MADFPNGTELLLSAIDSSETILRVELSSHHLRVEIAC
jgi:hypothetical protein